MCSCADDLAVVVDAKELLSTRVGRVACRESTALGVREPKRSRTKLFAEDAILFPEIVNHTFLVAIHPASNSEHEELQCMGHRERLLGREAVHRTARNDSPGLGRFFAPYGIPPRASSKP